MLQKMTDMPSSLASSVNAQHTGKHISHTNISFSPLFLPAALMRAGSAS